MSCDCRERRQAAALAPGTRQPIRTSLGASMPAHVAGRYGSLGNQAIQRLLGATLGAPRSRHEAAEGACGSFACPLAPIAEAGAAQPPAVIPAGGQAAACEAPDAELHMRAGTVRADRTERGFAIAAGSSESASTVGMAFEGCARVAPPDCGVLAFVQNVQSSREFRYRDGSTARLTLPTWHLDGHGVYGSDPVLPSRPTFPWRVTSDSPAQAIGGFPEADIDRMVIEDSFRMFLLLRPPGTLRTLLAGTWKFRGEATNAQPGRRDGRLALRPSRSYVERVGVERTEESPVLGPRAQAIPWQVVSGRRERLARRHVPILNELER